MTDHVVGVVDELLEVTERYPALHPLNRWLHDIRPQADAVLAQLI